MCARVCVRAQRNPSKRTTTRTSHPHPRGAYPERWALLLPHRGREAQGHRPRRPRRVCRNVRCCTLLLKRNPKFCGFHSDDIHRAPYVHPHSQASSMFGAKTLPGSSPSFCPTCCRSLMVCDTRPPRPSRSEMQQNMPRAVGSRRSGRNANPSSQALVPVRTGMFRNVPDRSWDVFIQNLVRVTRSRQLEKRGLTALKSCINIRSPGASPRAGGLVDCF